MELVWKLEILLKNKTRNQTHAATRNEEGCLTLIAQQHSSINTTLL